MDKNKKNQFPSEDELKSFVDRIVEKLKSKGITVDGAAILKVSDKDSKNSEQKFPENEKTGEQRTEQEPKSFEEFMKNMFNKPENPFKKLLDDMFNPDSDFMKKIKEIRDQEPKEFCSCPNCLTYDNFEQMVALHPDKGEVHYQTFTVAGKDFSVKYWKNSTDDKEDYMMIRDMSKENVSEDSSLESLHDQLKQAVMDEDFEKAKVIKDIINAKTKN